REAQLRQPDGAGAASTPSPAVSPAAAKMTPESWSLFPGVQHVAPVAPPPLDGPGKGATFWPAGTASARRKNSSSAARSDGSEGSEASGSDSTGNGADASGEEDSEGDSAMDQGSGIDVGGGGGGGGSGSGRYSARGGG
ncbi:unnamed protein product, partial [Laminaria digitata]